MSTLKADTLQAKTTDGTLTLSNNGTGKVELPSDATIGGTPLLVTPGTSGNILTSDGTNWTSAAAAAAGNNGFAARLSGHQTINASTNTIATFNSELFDTDSTFAAYTWTPAAGNIIVGANCTLYNFVTAGRHMSVRIMKNGTGITDTTIHSNEATTYLGCGTTYADAANGTDTYKLQVYHNDSASKYLLSDLSIFWGIAL